MLISSHKQDHTERIEDILQQTTREVLKCIRDVEAANSTQIPKIANVKKCVVDWYSDISVYHHRDAGQVFSWEKAVSQARLKLAELRKQVEDRHADNAAAISSNKKVIESVTALMTEIGVPKSYSTYEYKTKRARTRTQIENYAGYLQDLRRCCATDDGYEAAKKSLEQFEATINKYEAVCKQNDALSLREKEREERAQSDQRALAALVVKYNLPITATAEDVHLCMLKRDYDKDDMSQIESILERSNQRW